MIAESGCVVDGVRGLYESYLVLIGIAADGGWPIDEWVGSSGGGANNPTRVDRAWFMNVDPEQFVMIADEALEFINEKMVTPGFRVDWHEGDVMCFSDDEWEQVLS